MTMSKVDQVQGRDNYEPIKRLAMVEVQPARNPGKPFTSFCIRDILGISNKDHKINLQHCYHPCYQLNVLHKSSIKHKSRGAGHIGSNGNTKNNSVSAGNTSHKNSFGCGRDVQEDLVNLCKVDQHRNNVRPDFSGNPCHRSAPVNGRCKPDIPNVLPALHHAPPGEQLQARPQTNPVNLTTKIVRPWDNDFGPCSLSVGRSSSSPTTCANMAASDTSSEEDEEITVDDEDVPTRVLFPSDSNKSKSVSPLDALVAMTSKTFEGLDGGGSADVRRRDQTTLFGKHQPPKKRRKSRTAFTNQQIYELEKRFLYQKYLTPVDRDEIAATLGLTNAQVITWFQNRRAKLKRDLEELKNDVTAAKKLPVQKSGPDSLEDVELGKVQHKVLTDRFSIGGIQSPSSLASFSDEPHDGSVTPSHSPCASAVDAVEVEVIVSVRKYEEPMDDSCCDDKNNENVNNGDDRLVKNAEIPSADLTRQAGDHYSEVQSCDPGDYSASSTENSQTDRCLLHE